MIWPPPRARGSGATTASVSLNLTLRIGSSHRGPSLAPHWNPCTTLLLMALTSDLSTSDGSVSSRNTLGPSESGANAQQLRAAMTSQPYDSWKNPATRFLGQSSDTSSPRSMSSARPLSSGSAMIVSLFFLLDVSAKHLRLLVSTTVSQKDTTGSATLTSTSL